MACWRELISDEINEHHESWKDVIDHIPKGESWLEEKFCDGYGELEGCAFTLWTTKRVYFPTVHGGAEWVESVSRDPCNERTRHMGGQ